MSGTASSAAALRRALAARLPPFSPRAAARGISSTAQPNVRTANPGLRATIFGAYGFTGRYITNLLASDGVQCVAQGLGLGLCARAAHSRLLSTAFALLGLGLHRHLSPPLNPTHPTPPLFICISQVHYPLAW